MRVWIHIVQKTSASLYGFATAKGDMDGSGLLLSALCALCLLRVILSLCLRNFVPLCLIQRLRIGSQRR